MKRLFSSPDLFAINQLKVVLEQMEIRCAIRNEISAGLVGEIPLTECTPELWIEEDQQLVRAQEIKADWQGANRVIGSVWECAACGETLEAQFSSCWKCGSPRKS